MKLIIAGSRWMTDYEQVRKAAEAFVAKHGRPTEVVSGGARGVDQMGEAWARSVGIPVVVFQAEWAKLGRAAGPKRNVEMAQYADALLAIWDGDSPGTRNMIATAAVRGKLVEVVVPGQPGKSTLLVL